MDKIFSTRIDEAIIQRIGMLAKQLHTSKKAIIEKAVMTFSEKVEKEKSFDLLEQTFGAWKRNEAPQNTIDKARSVFRDSMERHRK